MHRTNPDGTAIDDGGELEPERLAYSVPEAARLIGMSARRLWDRVRDKDVKSFREGTRRLISRRALEDFIAKREAVEDDAA